MHRPGPEQQDLGRDEQRRERGDAHAPPGLPSGQEGSLTPGPASEQQDRSAHPDQQHRIRQPGRGGEEPVADRPRVGGEQAPGSQGRRLAPRPGPPHVQVVPAAALPMQDLQLVRAGTELDGHGLRVHADRGVALQHGHAVEPHDHAVVGAGVQIDAFRAWGKPDAPPADEVVARRPAPLGEKVEVDARRLLVGARTGRERERPRVGVARQGIVVGAGEPAGRGQGAGDQPEDRQQGRGRRVA